jgi:hypothetical protein
LTRILPADQTGSATAATRTPGQLSLFCPPVGVRPRGRRNSTSAQKVEAVISGDPATPAASRRALRSEAAPRQARLRAFVDPGAHERALAAALHVYLPPGKGLELRLTNNHYSMISVRRKPDGYRLRLHRMFIGAEARIVRALGRYVVHNDRRASRVLGDYIDGHQHIIKKQPRRPRQVNLRTVGVHHDLRAIFDRLNDERFDSALEARITWGPVVAHRARRSIKMGSFAVEDKIIRIHPILDQPDVPEFFVAWIVFHEMLHGKHDIVRKGHRRIFHGQAFVDEERAYPDHQRATEWERANLDRLLGG